MWIVSETAAYRISLWTVLGGVQTYAINKQPSVATDRKMQQNDFSNSKFYLVSKYLNCELDK